MSLLDGKNQAKICLTLKNYKFAKGVSTQIHKIVPVLDAPEDLIIDMLAVDADTSRELNGSGDFNSPDKHAARYLKKKIDDYQASPKVYLPTDAIVMAATDPAVVTECGFNLDDCVVEASETGRMRPMSEMFSIKGPMGRGLEIKQKGLHVAFCAGTGVLVFLDLVAYLLMRNVFSSK